MAVRLNLFLYLVMLLAVLVSKCESGGGGKQCFECEMNQYYGVALVETWSGRSAINVGDITYNQLDQDIENAIAKDCPVAPSGSSQGWCMKPNIGNIKTSYPNPPDKKNKWPTFGGESSLSFSIEMNYASGLLRTMLINRASHSVGRLIQDPSKNSNCYVLSNAQYCCNIGDFIKVNLPKYNNVDNYIILRFQGGGTVYSTFKCCLNRHRLEYHDEEDGNLEQIYDKQFSESTRCLIGNGNTCESCGSKCDTCGAKCKDVCPKGKC